MTLAQALQRCKQIAALISRAPKKYEALIYFDGPRTKWTRSQKNWTYEEREGGLRIPISNDGQCMPKPADEETLQVRRFRFRWFAVAWVIARLKGFDHSKIVGEIRTI